MSNFFRRTPLRTSIVVPFLLQIFAVVGIVGWLSFRSGRKAVDDLVTQLSHSIADRIDLQTQDYLQKPYLIHQSILATIAAQKLVPEDFQSLQCYFWQQIEQPNPVDYLIFGFPDGNVMAVQRREDDRIVVKVRDDSTGGERHIYQLNDRCERMTRFQSTPYDARERSWYRAAIDAKQATWSPINLEPDEARLEISSAIPIYNDNGSLRGVLGAEFSLSQLTNFLGQLEISPSGEAFIIERSGEVVATSKPELLFVSDSEEAETELSESEEDEEEEGRRLQGIESTSPLVARTTEYLIERFGSLDAIQQEQLLNFQVKNGARQWVQVRFLQDDRGLDWLSVVVIPEVDFMEQIRQNTVNTVALCLVALAVAAYVGVLTGRWITEPICQLNAAARQLAQGGWERRVQLTRSDELGELAISFNRMAAQLQSAFIRLQNTNEELERRVVERTRELEKAKQAADRANQAKSEFLAHMSHELRTPLNGILGYAQILQRDRDTTPKQLDRLQIVEQCGFHLLTLINDVLDLSKIEAGKLELHLRDFHLDTFLKGVSDICRIKAEQKEMDFSYQALNRLPPAVRADEKRLRQVLVNLLGNAVKFTETGSVTFKVGEIDSSPNTEETPDGNREHPSEGKTPSTVKIRFQVEDTGIGMTPEQLQRIFQPFEQGEVQPQNVEGTGLGLAIARKLVRMMDSELLVESTPGVGSRFWFEVELLAAESWQAIEVESATVGINGYEGPRHKILVVDDRVANRAVLVDFLEPLGFEVEQATNGLEGLEKARSGQPDVIIADIVMPVMDGLEMTREIRQLPELAEMIIIASSASVFNFDRQKSWEVGCSDFLPKPVRESQLLEQLQKYLDLVWIYEAGGNLERNDSPSGNLQEDEESALVIPPPDRMRALYEAAQIGHIERMKREATRLGQSDKRFLPFANRVIELARSFEDEAILELIEPHMPKR